MEFIFAIKKEDWRQLNDNYIVFIPFDCVIDDVLELNILDNDEYIKEHQEFFNSLMGGLVLKGYGSIITKKEPECDILVKISKQHINNQQQVDLDSLAGIFNQLPKDEENVGIDYELNTDESTETLNES